jgi:flagellar protein FliO/FliZ
MIYGKNINLLNKRGYGIIFNLAVIFFTLIFILCPIADLHSADELKNSNNIDNEIGKDAVGNDNDAPDTLYNFEKPSVEEESYTWLVFKTILILAALVGGFYFFYRFVTKKTGMQTLGRDVINILSIVPVGQNKFLQVVELAGKILVLGISDSSINLITEIKDKDELDRIRLLSSKSSPVRPGGFQDYLSKYVSKLFGKGIRGKEYEINEGKYTDRMDSLRKQRERLKKMNGGNNEV